MLRCNAAVLWMTLLNVTSAAIFVTRECVCVCVLELFYMIIFMIKREQDRQKHASEKNKMLLKR